MQISTSDKVLLLLIQQNNRQLVGVETCRLLHTHTHTQTHTDTHTDTHTQTHTHRHTHTDTHKLEKTCLEINGLSLHILAEADK